MPINVSRSLLKRILLWSTIAVTVYTIVGFFVVPMILGSVIPPRLSGALNRQVRIDRVRFNPYTWGVSLRGMRVTDRTGKDLFASAKEVYVNLRITSLVRRAVVFGHARIEAPYLMLIRSRDGSYNFEDLFEGQGHLPRLSLNNMKIANGSIDFRDDMKGVTHTIRDMMVNIPFLSNIPYYANVYIHPLFSAAIDGAPYEIKGKTKPFARSLETEMRLVAENVELPPYASYLPPSAGIKVPSGLLNADLTIRYSQYAAKPPTLIVSGEVGLEKLSVQNAEGQSLVDMPRLAVAILSADVLTRDVKLGQLTLTSPTLSVRRDESGALNLPSVISSGRASGRESTAGKGGLSRGSVRIDQAIVTNGRLTFADYRPKEPFFTTLEAVSVRLTNFTTEKNGRAHFFLSARTDAEEQVSAEGDLSLTPLDAHGQVIFKSMALDRYTAYYRDRLPFLLEGGRMNLSSRYRLTGSFDDPSVVLSALDLSLSNVAVKEPRASSPALKVPILSLKNGEVDMTRRTLNIEEVSTDQGVVRLARSGSGITLPGLLPPSGKPSGKAEKAGPSPDWVLKVKHGRVKGYTVSFEDQGASGKRSTMRARNLDIRIEDLSTAKDARAEIAISSGIGAKGSISAQGGVIIDPLQVEMRMAAKNVGLALLQPYLPSGINLSIEAGTVSAEGNLSARRSGAKAPSVTFSGSLSTAGFASTDTVTGDRFIAWRSLSISTMSAGYNPLFLKSGEIVVDDYYCKLALTSEGVLNVQHIVQQEQEQQASGPSQAGKRSPDQSAPSLSVGPLTLKSGTIDFTDQYIKPPYSARLTQLNGVVSGISSEAKAPANIEIRGQVNNYAPMKIAGTVDLFGEAMSLNIAASVSDLDLTSMSPYSAHYVGYTVQKGTLALDATYLLANRKLEANNKIGLEQLQLGRQVETEPVIQLPVKLALSILRDRQGNIAIDVPVSGDVSDPRFSFTGAIAGSIRNLVTRVVTSPFSFIGSLFGGGHGKDLGYIEFDYGSADVSTRGIDKAKVMVKALEERPQMRLSISGYVDVANDREGLKERRFMNLLKERKREDLMQGDTPPPLNSITMEAGEYNKYLEKAYKAAKFPKPRNILGLAQSVPPAEMEKLLKEHITITDQDLTNLALARAVRVRTAILTSKGIQPDRLAILESSPLQPAPKENIRASRVEFGVQG